ncbi:hypothetical protein MLD38_029253 [Melastoma candidum]|uniref:Uncharacterized protein n=1 Tax=Melastoma candidum TaxID=119954 RepID=A0ACB9N4W5_9MYRT|nr:hypothetical protein MLD38_029253 [Melastoma candidum]
MLTGVGAYLNILGLGSYLVTFSSVMDAADPFPLLQLYFRPPKHPRGCDPGRPSSAPSPISLLPWEILLLILSRLPLTSRVRCKYVCRAWRSLVEGNPESFPPRSSPMGRDCDPCVLFHCDRSLGSSLCFVDFADEERLWKVRRLHLPFKGSMPEFEVVGSCDGLVCAVDSLQRDQLVVWDVFGRDRWDLPKMEGGNRGWSNEGVVFGFGRDSVSGELKVVRVSRKRVRIAGGDGVPLPQSEVHVCTLGSNTWRMLPAEGPILLFGNSSQPVVNGRLHWATIPCHRNRESRIVSFDLSSEQFGIVSQPDCLDFGRSHFTLFLTDGCVSTANVMFSRGALDIWVMKVYDMAESWIKWYRIGPHVPRSLKEMEVDPGFKMSRTFWRGRRLSLT